MRMHPVIIMAPMLFTAIDGRGAEPGRFPNVCAVSGHLFDEGSGQWIAEDVLDPGYVPFNKLAIPLFVVATLNLGEACVMRQPSPEEARAIAKGERPPFERPAACQKPPGTLAIVVKHSDGSQDRQTATLSRFPSGEDGKIRVPFLFYRRLPCEPLEVAAQVSTNPKPLVKKVNFTCSE